MILPNFFIVGAPKAGTTSLYHYLGQHPAIYMSPVKEPAYFAADLAEHKRQLGITEPDAAGLRSWLAGPMTQPREGVIEEWADYLALFRNVRDQTAVGEASGNYLASRSAPAAIRERIPHARIIMLLRDPVARLFSQHGEAVAQSNVEPDFLSWVEQQAQQPRLGALCHGFYAQHVERYFGVFPEHQVRIHLYEDYARTPLGVLRDLFSFLEVDPEFPADVTRRHNVTLHPRFAWARRVTAPARAQLRRVLPEEMLSRIRRATHRRARPITVRERAEVLAIYADEIRRLEDLLKRDLSAWRRLQ